MDKKGILWILIVCIVFITIASVFVVSNFGIAVSRDSGNQKPETIHIIETKTEPEETKTNDTTNVEEKEPETIHLIETEPTPKETIAESQENETKNEPAIIQPIEKPKEEPKPDVPPAPKLVPTGNYCSVDRSAYTKEEIALLDMILEKVKTANQHDLHEEIINIDTYCDYYSYYKVASYFYVYYGQKRAVDETFDYINYTDSDGSRYWQVRIRYDDIREFEKEFNQNKTKIDNVLSTFTQGSEEHILKQISKYLGDKISYTDGYYDLSSALDGKSVCNGYALAFNAMANRAGIKTDMCIGKVKGVYHAWNRVTLKDGSYRFYDITFYDTGKGNNINYLHSTKNFHGSYSINDYTDCLHDN